MARTTLSDPARFQPQREASPDRVFADAWLAFGRHRLLIIAVPLLVSAAFVAFGILRPRTFTSAAAFMGASADVSGAGLANLASQFGFRLPARDATQSPQFYADLLRSRQVLDSVVRTRYAYHDDAGQLREGTLVDAFEVKAATPALQVENAITALDRHTSIAVGRETGVVRLSVSTKYPELSTAIARRFLELVNSFNLETRQTRARSERRFTQERMAQVAGELRAAEERLKGFIRANRAYMTSPTLALEYDRLQREVMMRQEVYATLMQAFEQARIDEVRDTPVITTVEPPYLPVRPDRRGLLRLALFGGVLGVIVAVGLALARERLPALRMAALRRAPA